MRLLVVSPREPWATGKGDQVRLAQVLPALAARHRVTLLHATEPGGPSAPEPLPATVTGVPVPVTRSIRLRSAAYGWLRGRPGQIGWFAPGPLADEVRRRAGDHDLVLFMTSRAVVPVSVPAAVDHIDCVSVNAARRATSYRHPFVRLLWREESRRLRRWEQRVAWRCVAQLVTSPADAAELPPEPAPVVVPNGVQLSRRANVSADSPRDIDVILTGNMEYPPNRDAALWLGQEIAPRLADEAGRDVRVVLAGRSASKLPALAGVEILSDVPDLAALLCRAKVAIAPLRIGTGIPNKVLEAALADAALVLTPQANAALGLPPSAAAVASDAAGLARETAQLLRSAELRSARRHALAAQLPRFDLRLVGDTYAAAVAAALPAG